MHANDGGGLELDEFSASSAAEWRSVDDESVIDISVVEAATSLRQIMRDVAGRQHRQLHNEMEQLVRLVARVVEVHGEEFPELRTLQTRINALSERVLTHFLKEEQTLFAYIARLEQGEISGRAIAKPFFASARNGVYLMSLDHLEFVSALAAIRAAAAEFETSSDACLEYLLKRIEFFHNAMFDNLHVENEVLFPRAIELEHDVEEQVQVILNGPPGE